MAPSSYMHVTAVDTIDGIVHKIFTSAAGVEVRELAFLLI
jgi:hypothetical protein